MLISYVNNLLQQAILPSPFTDTPNKHVNLKATHPAILGFTQFYLLPRFYPGFTQLPRVKLGKTVRRFYPPTMHIFIHSLKILTSTIPKGIPEKVLRRPGLSVMDSNVTEMKNWLIT